MYQADQTWRGLHDHRYALALVAAPQAEPVDLAEGKLHLRVDPDLTDEDDLIRSMIAAARQNREGFLSRALVAATYDYKAAGFPCDYFGQVELPRPPLRSVTWVKYVDTGGTLQTLDPALYAIDLASLPGKIYPAYGQYWPATRWQPDAVQVRYVAGDIVPFTADDGTDLVTPKGLGFANDTVIRLTNSGGTLPAGLNTATDYYVVQASGASFKLSLTLGGSALDITDKGAGTHFIGALAEDIRAAIKLVLAELYEHRSESVEGVRIIQDVRHTADLLCWQHRIVPV